MECQNFSTLRALEVILEMTCIGSLFDASYAFFSILISAVITPQMDG